ncbi:MAG: GNAT family N-acetyltransferase [Lachnospiraceae bacterium]|nr:GNAT family N-acetyltransferase [Lachnospiraceae bacterium]
MKYVCALIAVKDIEKSKRFYQDVLGLGVVDDFGANVTLEGGIALQTLDTWQSFIRTDQIVLQNNAGELYFEEDDLDGFCERLRAFEIRYVHALFEHRWGQRVVRFYDPDGHIIEVGEKPEAVVRRFAASGLSPEETAGRMDVPLEYVRSSLKKEEDPEDGRQRTAYTVTEERELTEELLDVLLRLSADWEAENSCHGYRRNEKADIEGSRVFTARDGAKVVGYLLGRMEKTERDTSVTPAGTPVFEVEEIYVKPECRSQGIGKALFGYAEEAVRDGADFIMLSTATKDRKAILHFYLDELGMEFWSARLFKKLQ